MERWGSDEMRGKIADLGAGAVIPDHVERGEHVYRPEDRARRHERAGHGNRISGSLQPLVEGAGGRPREFAILSVFRRDG
ncbi:hypothetical protein C6Q14_24785 [Burkholderia ambifaria]|nr:hypothetical protein C6Q14_24785 [Burkholderia ambifaria]